MHHTLCKDISVVCQSRWPTWLSGAPWQCGVQCGACLSVCTNCQPLIPMQWFCVAACLWGCAAASNRKRLPGRNGKVGRLSAGDALAVATSGHMSDSAALSKAARLQPHGLTHHLRQDFTWPDTVAVRRYCAPAKCYQATRLVGGLSPLDGTCLFASCTAAKAMRLDGKHCQACQPQGGGRG
jgi:hypothetical protein